MSASAPSWERDSAHHHAEYHDREHRESRDRRRRPLSAPEASEEWTHYGGYAGVHPGERHASNGVHSGEHYSDAYGRFQADDYRSYDGEFRGEGYRGYESGNRGEGSRAYDAEQRGSSYRGCETEIPASSYRAYDVELRDHRRDRYYRGQGGVRRDDEHRGYDVDRRELTKPLKPPPGTWTVPEPAASVPPAARSIDMSRERSDELRLLLKQKLRPDTDPYRSVDPRPVAAHQGYPAQPLATSSSSANASASVSSRGEELLQRSEQLRERLKQSSFFRTARARQPEGSPQPQRQQRERSASPDKRVRGESMRPAVVLRPRVRARPPNRPAVDHAPVQSIGSSSSSSSSAALRQQAEYPMLLKPNSSRALQRSGSSDKEDYLIDVVERLQAPPGVLEDISSASDTSEEDDEEDEEGSSSDSETEVTALPGDGLAVSHAPPTGSAIQGEQPVVGRASAGEVQAAKTSVVLEANTIFNSSGVDEAEYVDDEDDDDEDEESEEEEADDHDEAKHAGAVSEAAAASSTASTHARSVSGAALVTGTGSSSAILTSGSAAVASTVSSVQAAAQGRSRSRSREDAHAFAEGGSCAGVEAHGLGAANEDREIAASAGASAQLLKAFDEFSSDDEDPASSPPPEPANSPPPPDMIDVAASATAPVAAAASVVASADIAAGPAAASTAASVAAPGAATAAAGATVGTAASVKDAAERNVSESASSAVASVSDDVASAAAKTVGASNAAQTPVAAAVDAVAKASDVASATDKTQTSSQAPSATGVASSSGVADAPKTSGVASGQTNVTTAAGAAVRSASTVPASTRPAKRPRSADYSEGVMKGWQSLLDRTRRHPHYVSEYIKRFQTEGRAWRRPDPNTKARLVLGLDCEMVYAKGDPNALARVSVVGVGGNSLLDVYVNRAESDVLDYRTPISGVEPKHLLEESGALPFADVQQRVLDLISPDTILVGHALQNDLRAMRICHLKIVDTAYIFAVEGKSQWRKHRLHSLVSIMKTRVATLQSVSVDVPHDSTQDAEWALQLALYEASIHPRQTFALQLETFPTKVFLSEIPKGTTKNELKAIFGVGVVSDVSYQLQETPPEWQGTATVLYNTQAQRDAVLQTVPRFVGVHVGPLHDWAGRRDIKRMESDLMKHFVRFGRVRGCRVFRPAAMGPTPSSPVAVLDCHPATARVLLTTVDAQYFSAHSTQFKLQLAKDDPAGMRRVVVPVGNGGSFVAKIQ